MIQEVYQNKLLINEYRLKALYAQINPHFLYNTLGLINNKAIMADQDEISHMTLLLAQFYRTCLNHGKEITTIEKELENIRLYLEIQQITYHHNFEVLWQINSNLYAIEMPNFILQPIVENAIFHGLDEIEEGGIVTIKTTRSEDDLYITVTDNGVGFSKEKLYDLTRKLEEEITFINNSSSETSDNIGVINIHNKIRLYEGNNYGLSINNIPNHTSVTLHLNAKQQTTT